MIERCTRPAHHAWSNYGGRGIEVCERWRSFEAFLADMGERPVGKTLDRYPNRDGNYEPGNCRWATWAEQRSNSRQNHMLTFRGEECTLTEWSRRVDIGKSTIRQRLLKGWSVEAALTTAPLPHEHCGSIRKRTS